MGFSEGEMSHPNEKLMQLNQAIELLRNNTSYLTLYLEKVVFIKVIHSAGTAHLFCPVAGFSWLCDNCFKCCEPTI